MERSSSVYTSLSKKYKNTVSKRSRLIILILSIIFPVGIHNFYLGYYIKGIVQVGMAIGIIMFIPPFILVFLLPIYIAWIISEGMIYFLWYNVKDGYDFRLYDVNKPPKQKRKTAIYLAFFLPFGLHNIYLGRLKRGVVEFGFVIVILSMRIIFQVIPIIFLSPYLILIVVVISWVEGVWILVKD